MRAGCCGRSIRHAPRWLPCDGGRARRRLPVVGPQIYISKQNSDSFNPYPSPPLFSQQVALGITLLKFATVEDEGHWRGLTYWSPFVAEPEEDKTVRFYLDHPARAAFLMLDHVYAGFHYDQIMPYWQLDRARPLTIWLVLSSAIVFLGVVAHDRPLSSPARLDPDRAFTIATLVLCAASLRSSRPNPGSASSASRCCRSRSRMAREPAVAPREWSLLVPGAAPVPRALFPLQHAADPSADIRL